jgi:hypothetical protein
MVHIMYNISKYITNIITMSSNTSNDSNKDKNNNIQVMTRIKAIEIKLGTIEKIIECFPQLKKDKQVLINYVLGKSTPKPNDYVLDKVVIGNKVYYRDPCGLLMDANTKLVGTSRKNGIDGYVNIMHGEFITKVLPNGKKILVKSSSA